MVEGYARMTFEITVLFSGEFGSRLVLNLVYPEACPKLGACGIELCVHCKDYDFSPYISLVKEFADPLTYGTCIDEPRELLPETTDLIIAINLHPDLLLELPSLEPKAILAPVENSKWCTPGLRNQIARICEESGIEFAAPKPLCSFKPETRLLKKLSKKLTFSMPEFEVEVENSRIVNVEAIADTCGCSHFVARKMSGYEIESREEFWKEVHQHQCAYPCMASMEKDAEIGESPFQLAGYILGKSFSDAVGIDCMDFIPDYIKDHLRGKGLLDG